MPKELPIVPEMVVLAAPLTFNDVLLLFTVIPENAPLSVSVVSPGAPLLLIVRGWPVATEMFVATVWLASVVPATVIRLSDVPLFEGYRLSKRPDYVISGGGLGVDVR